MAGPRSDATRRGSGPLNGDQVCRVEVMDSSAVGSLCKGHELRIVSLNGKWGVTRHGASAPCEQRGAHLTSPGCTTCPVRVAVDPAPGLLRLLCITAAVTRVRSPSRPRVKAVAILIDSVRGG